MCSGPLELLYVDDEVQNPPRTLRRIDYTKAQDNGDYRVPGVKLLEWSPVPYWIRLEGFYIKDTKVSVPLFTTEVRFSFIHLSLWYIEILITKVRVLKSWRYNKIIIDCPTDKNFLSEHIYDNWLLLGHLEGNRLQRPYRDLGDSIFFGLRGFLLRWLLRKRSREGVATGRGWEPTGRVTSRRCKDSDPVDGRGGRVVDTDPRRSPPGVVSVNVEGLDCPWNYFGK